MPSYMEAAYHATRGQGLLVRAATRAWTFVMFALMTVQMIMCYLRLLCLAVPLCRTRSSELITFGEWAELTVPGGFLARWSGANVVWREFVYMVLLPLFSAVCTAPAEDVLRHPVEEFLGGFLFVRDWNDFEQFREIDYVWLTFGTHHYVVINGVRDVVSRLSSTVKNIHVSSTISAIFPDPQAPDLASIRCDTPQGPVIHNGFHHIILASQATRAIPLLASYYDSLAKEDPKRQAVGDQIRCLHAFEYRNTIVVNHTDPSMMPDNVEDQRELNLICASRDPDAFMDEKTDITDCVSTSYTMATHVLALPRGLPRIYQTTNPFVPPEQSRVLSVAKLERAVVTVQSKEALKRLYREERRRWWQCASQGDYRLGELQGAGKASNLKGPGIWICGSFAYAGIPLLEGCVVSARGVVEQGVWKSEGIEVESSPW